MVNAQSGTAGTTDAEKIDLAKRHQNIMATIDSLTAIETSILNNLQSDMNNGANIEAEVQKISTERSNHW